MSIARTLAVALAFAATTALAATDYSDNWGPVPGEPGWGVNFVHQGNLLYATFFVYDSAGRPQWHAAPMLRDGTSERFTGPMARYAGTWFGAPAWSGAQAAAVGTSTFTATSATTGTLAFTIDGVAVTKTVERSTYVPVGVAGTYLGAVSGRRSGCGGPGLIIDPMQFDILHSTTSGAIRIDHISTASGQIVCRMEGTAVQYGRLLAVNDASYSCVDGWRSTARIDNLRPTAAGFEGRYAADAGGGCTESGQFSGVTQFP